LPKSKTAKQKQASDMSAKDKKRLDWIQERKPSIEWDHQRNLFNINYGGGYDQDLRRAIDEVMHHDKKKKQSKGDL
jgi:hypothetical protein